MIMMKFFKNKKNDQHMILGLVAALMLCIGGAVFHKLFGNFKEVILEGDVPLSSGIVISKGGQDDTDIIQNAFHEAAEKGLPVLFENKSGEDVYYVSRTIIIPDGLTIIGNGATLAIDSNRMDSFAWARENTRNDARYREFCIMNEGMLTQEITTFSMDGLKVVLRDDHGTRGIPETLIGFGYMRDVKITNCEFATYSEIHRGLTTFDVYTTWNSLYISNCTFHTLHDGNKGGVWLRNVGGEEAASGAVIENCVFNNRAADEILTLYANHSRKMSDVTVRNCEFYCYTSEYNNPNHFITLGNTGDTTGLLFEHNYIYMEAVWNSVIKMRAHETKGSSDHIVVRNNTIVVDDVMLTANQIITGDDVERYALVEGNSITVNTKSGIMKHGISGSYTQVINNSFYGNGYDTVCYNIRYAEGNLIEQCRNAFIGIIDCIGNTVLECSDNLVMCTAANFTPDESSRQVIRLERNTFTSSIRALITTSVNALLYCDIIMKNNVIYGGRIWASNTTATLELYGNLFHIKYLDDITFNGKITQMSGNKFYDMNGAALVSASVWPQGNNFNRSLAVGIVIEFGTMQRSGTGGIIGYKKVAEGTTKDTWESVYSSG